MSVLYKEKGIGRITFWNDYSPAKKGSLTGWHFGTLAMHLHFRIPGLEPCKIESVLLRIIGFLGFCIGEKNLNALTGPQM